jgi:hypothetical protein
MAQKKRRNPAAASGWVRGFASLNGLNDPSCTIASTPKQPEQANSLTNDAYVYIDRHIGDGKCVFFSVNYFDGEGGFQEGPFTLLLAANARARALGRELVCKVRP